MTFKKFLPSLTWKKPTAYHFQVNRVPKTFNVMFTIEVFRGFEVTHYNKLTHENMHIMYTMKYIHKCTLNLPANLNTPFLCKSITTTGG